MSPVKKKIKSQHVTISKEDEKKIAEFIENSADYIFNKGSRYYKDKPKVVAAFAELGQTLNPPVSGKELRVWWYSIRSRFGRLTTKKSGQGSEKRLTEREQWILDIFHFLGPHIVRQRKTKQVGFSVSCT